MSRRKGGCEKSVGIEFAMASADDRQAEDYEGDETDDGTTGPPIPLRRVRGGTTRHVDEWLHVDAQIRRLIAKGKLG